jgi:hypothetical protein
MDGNHIAGLCDVGGGGDGQERLLFGSVTLVITIRGDMQFCGIEEAGR